MLPTSALSPAIDHDHERRRSAAAAWLFLTALPRLRALDADAHREACGDDGEPHEHLIFVGAQARERVRAEARIAHELVERVVAGEALRSPRLPSIVAATADVAAIDVGLDVPACVELALTLFHRALFARTDAQDALLTLTYITLCVTSSAHTARCLGGLPADSAPAGTARDMARFVEIAPEVESLVGAAFAIAVRKELAEVALAALSGGANGFDLSDRVERVLDRSLDDPSSALFGQIDELGRSAKAVIQG